MNCGYCKQEIKESWCMVGKESLEKHKDCTHPMFCSQECQQKYLALYSWGNI